MAYGAKYYAMRGDPGFLGGLVKGIGKVAGAVGKIPGVGLVARALPGVGTIATLAGPAIGLAKKVAGGVSAAAPATKALVPYNASFAMSQATGQLARAGGRLGGLALGGGAAAAGAYGVSKMLGGSGRRYRRMNPLNPKAANRAIRRIKAVRKVCHQIESHLPKQRGRACATGFKRRGR